jgi:hypothetical protein
LYAYRIPWKEFDDVNAVDEADPNVTPDPALDVIGFVT